MPNFQQLQLSEDSFLIIDEMEKTKLFLQNCAHVECSLRLFTHI